MIRKSGWLIFLILVALVLGLVYVFGGTAIRIATVHALQRAVGAEVNVDDASLSLAPLSVRIEGLAITDASEPTRNSVSFDRARASLALWPALLGYYVIDELTVEGLALGGKRASPGKVFRGEHATEAQPPVDLETLLRLDLPSAEELMARANLQTVAKGKALQQTTKAQKELLEALKAQLPDRERLAQIQSEIEQLTDSKIESPADLAAKSEQLKQLKATLSAEREKLRQVQQELTESREQLQTAVQAVREAGENDWQQLKQLTNIGEGGLAPISQILLGEYWGERIEQLDTLYRIAKPYLPESKGDGAPGAEESALPDRILPLPSQPYPNFWIKNAHVKWQVGGGEATIDLVDVTRQHPIIGKPTRLALDVQGLPRLKSLQLDGDLAILQQMVVNLSWQMEKFQPEQLFVGKGENQLNLTAGLLSSTGSLKLVDTQVEQQAQVVLQEPAFSASGNRYLQQLAQLLDQQAQIPLRLSATGPVSEPEVRVRSPLDRVVGDALLGEVKVKIAQLESQLRSRLDAQLAEQLGAEQDWLALLDQRKGEAQALDAQIEGLLEAKLTDVRAGARDRLKDKLLKRERD